MINTASASNAPFPFMEATDVKKAFGAIVKLRRTRQGLSQEALAEKANLHRTYITDIERGTRNLTLESISKLARALGISMREFFPVDAASPAPTQTVSGARSASQGENQ